eukprot:GFUD01033757.1.p1 GENE.GFUD01033757.1~~GFUD01033757.1.p1  ORF type:complete len:262 (-),score=77.86 GFUD01033757.1:50-835(-)
MKLQMSNLRSLKMCLHQSQRHQFLACLQSVRSNSSMFGSQFKDNSTQVKSDTKRILHLNVSHGEGSLVAEGARTFLSNLNTSHSVTELNLWSREDMVHYTVNHARSKLNILKGSASQNDQELFSPVMSAAQTLNLMDMVVISTPMWNYSVPYVLKQYIDTVVQPGINFCDENQASLEHLKGRHLVVFSSAGAVYDSSSELKDYLNPFIGQVFGLMGFDKQEFVFIQGTSIRTREELEMWTQEEALRIAGVVSDSIGGELVL